MSEGILKTQGDYSARKTKSLMNPWPPDSKLKRILALLNLIETSGCQNHTTNSRPATASSHEYSMTDLNNPKNFPPWILLIY
jgi:hypothetical protein